MSHPVEAQTRPRKYPFVHMRIADHSVLDSIEGRHVCRLCNRSRKFFCYSCHIPVEELEKLLPRLGLPLQIDIIKHKKEIDGKSTAVHAAVLAPEHVRIHTYPDIPDYRLDKDVVLIFPSAKSLTVPQLFERNVQLKIDDNYGLPKGHHMGTMLRRRVDEIEVLEDQPETTSKRSYTYGNLPVRRAVFIDSTWNQSRGIYADERVRGLRTVVLQNRLSQFWRHQRGSPRWYLATIEAIHQFVLEVHVNAWGLNSAYRGLDNLEITEGFHQLAAPLTREAPSEDVERESPYNGQYDNLLYFFANMYDLIHKYYDHNDLISYRRPI
ncbi:DTW domain-containing protein 1 [Drosophila pseudoobscura]|uniref:tRNA-uridine aminocarboxypropyltransferase 1 n=1 Tax=Drosophila pseudoobscura pseudoobscura TaxID=46245 RepID=A0A6I8V320_DROPS|nr:DTW domain-containing protein 1 [Drosophila pseudoobscura]